MNSRQQVKDWILQSGAKAIKTEGFAVFQTVPPAHIILALASIEDLDSLIDELGAWVKPQ
jgi:hypothetical protein